MKKEKPNIPVQDYKDENLSLPDYNRETVSALLEAESIASDPNVKGYDDLDELFAELKKE